MSMSMFRSSLEAYNKDTQIQIYILIPVACLDPWVNISTIFFFSSLTREERGGGIN